MIPPIEADCDIKDGNCINPYHLHNDTTEPPHKEAAPIIPSVEADKELDKVLAWAYNDAIDGKPFAAVKSDVMAAIYEIGLSIIGADEPSMIITDQYNVRNDLRASQRKAWAKACGVAE